MRARSEGGILPVHLVIQLAVEFAHRGFKRGEFRRIILQQRAPLRHPGTEKVEDLGKEILPAALRVRVAGAERKALRGVGHHLDFEALGKNVDGRRGPGDGLAVVVGLRDFPGVAELREHRREVIHAERVAPGENRRVVELLRIEPRRADEEAVVAEHIKHDAEVAAAAFGGLGHFTVREHRAVEAWLAVIARHIIEQREALGRVEHAASGERRGLVAVAHVVPVEIPLAGGDELRGHARVIGIGNALLLRVLELDGVAARTDRGDEAVFQKETLRGEHEARDVLHRLRVRPRAGGIGARVGAAVVNEGRDGQRGVGTVVGGVVAFGDVIAARELILRVFSRRGIDDRDIPLIHEDLVAPAAEAILHGGLGEHGDAMAAEPAAGLAEIAGDAEAEDFVGRFDAVLEPHGFEVEAADEGIRNRARSTVGARQRGVGIGAEIGARDRHAVGLDVGGIAEIGELGDEAQREALLHGDLPSIEGLVTRAPGPCEIVAIRRDGGRQQRLDAIAVHGLELPAVVVDCAILIGEGEALVRGAEAVEAGERDGAVGERLAGVLPRGDLVLAVPAEGEVVVHAPLLVGDVDGGELERLIRRRDGPTRLVVKVPVTPALGILIEAEQPHRECLRNEHPIVVGLVTLVAPRAEHRLERGAGAREVGLLAAEGDEAAGLAEAEEDGVGPTRNLGTLDVVEIDGDARLDEIARGTGGRAAHPEIEIVAVGPAAGGVVEARVRVLDVDLDVGRVRKHLLEVGRGDVGEKFGRERGDGGGRILEPGVEA